MEKRFPVIPGQDPFVHILDEENDRYLLLQSRGDREVVGLEYWLINERIERVGAHRLWKPSRRFAYRKHIWAPEMHQIDGRYYIYVCGDKGDNRSHRGLVLEGSSPTGEFEFVGKLCDPAHDFNAIDHTVFRLNGGLYCVWSGWDGPDDGFPQNLYIAQMSNPWTISGERRLLSRPSEGWEMIEARLLEAPQFYQAQDKTRQERYFLFYSCDGSWTPKYSMGVLEYNGGPVLDAASWIKAPYPLITAGGHGMGVTAHNRAWLVHHIKTSYDAGWSDRVIVWAPLTFDDDNSLIVREQHHEPWM